MVADALVEVVLRGEPQRGGEFAADGFRVRLHHGPVEIESAGKLAARLQKAKGRPVAASDSLDACDYRGARIMIIWRPSIIGSLSTLARVAVSALTRSSSLTPRSVCAISRPRKRSVTLTLSPSSKKRCTAFIFTS